MPPHDSTRIFRAARPRCGARRYAAVLGSAVVLASLAVGGGGLVALSNGLPAAAATTCAAAGSTGLTSALVATSSQQITGQTVDASGCNIGIYIGPNVTNVT